MYVATVPSFRTTHSNTFSFFGDEYESRKERDISKALQEEFVRVSFSTSVEREKEIVCTSMKHVVSV